MREVAPQAGWNERKRATEEWHQCPNCFLVRQSVILSEGIWTCYRCQTGTRLEDLGTVPTEVDVLTCANCGNDVPATPNNLYSDWGYICSKCNSTVAITFENNLLQPSTIFDISSSLEIVGRDGEIDDQLRIAEIRTAWELLVVHVMQSMAREEHEPFMNARLEEQRTALVFLPEDKKIVGYILWSDDGTEATLRQIYVLPAERRKGIASRLLDYWVREYADKVGDRFAVESPNEKSVGLLIKLGLFDESQASSSKCFFICEM
jgi:ribosomal protein S18 acetylase RimI-like enzyme